MSKSRRAHEPRLPYRLKCSNHPVFRPKTNMRALDPMNGSPGRRVLIGAA